MIAVPMAYAEQHLLISDLDVKVGDRWSRNVDDADTISREASPGDTVEFKLTFKNNYTDADNLKIEGITATVTIEGIDDDDDLDEESKEFDIREDDDKSVTVEFEIPVEVEEGNYDVTIEADGEDENGTDHSVKWTVYLEVQKEKHELRFYKTSLSPAEVKCNSVAYLTLGLINTGTEDEEDIKLTVTNNVLELSESVTIAELIEGAYDNDVKTSKKFRIEIPETVESGVYQIDAKAVYDGGDEEITQTFDLTVTECVVEEEPECVKNSDCEEGLVCKDGVCEKEEKEDVIVITKPTTPTTPTTPTITQPTITEPTTVTEEKSFFETGWFIGLLLGAEVVIIIVAVLLVLALVKRKAE